MIDSYPQSSHLNNGRLSCRHQGKAVLTMKAKETILLDILEMEVKETILLDISQAWGQHGRKK